MQHRKVNGKCLMLEPVGFFKQLQPTSRQMNEGVGMPRKLRNSVQYFERAFFYP